MKVLIGQAQPQIQPPEPQAQPRLDTNFWGSLGVFGVVLVSLAIAVAKTLPNYLDRFFQLKEASMKAQMQADLSDRASDLKREESTHGTLNEFTRTLLANQLQSSRQFQEEVSSMIQLQNQQLGLILQLLQDSKRNQERFFDLADQIKAAIAQLKLEVQTNRKIYRDTLIPKPPQPVPPPQLPPLPDK